MAASDHLSGAQFFHVAWPEDRESIRKNGLRSGDSGAVWFYTDLDLAKKDSAGSDIWQAHSPPNVVPGHEASAEWGIGDPTAASDNVPPEQIKLIHKRR